jgi:hypothetical protein
MTPVGAGAWWDPEDTTTPTARTPSHPRARLAPGSPARGGPGPTGDPVHEAAPSRWWTAGAVATGGLALVATSPAVARWDGWWAGLAAVAAVAAALLTVSERRQPRRVAASPSGVQVSSRRRSCHVPWHQLRRVRGPRETGYARVDTYLELDTGELVRLPRQTPGGAVEGWRDRFHGDRPDPRLPQVWRLSPEDALQQLSLVHNGGLLLGLAAVNLTNASLDLPAPAFLALYITVMVLMSLALTGRPARAIRVDEHGLTLPGWRDTHIPWSHVREVRRKGRYESQVVLELSPGGEREIHGPDLDVVTGWWHLAGPAGGRPAGTDD